MPFSFPLPRSLGSAVSCLLLQNRLAFSFQFTAPACFFVSFLAAFLLQIAVSARFPAYFLQCAQPPRRFLLPFVVPFLLFYFALFPLSPFAAFAKHFAQPSLSARLFSYFSAPLFYRTLLSSPGTGLLHCLNLCSSCYCFSSSSFLSPFPLFRLARTFPLCSLLIPPFKALFFLLCSFVSRAASHHTFPKTNCRLAALTAAPVCFYPFSFFSHALFFWHVYLALPCPNKAQRVFVSLFLSAFLPGCLSSFISACFYKPLFPGFPPKYPVAPPFLRTKKPAHSPVFSL